MLCCKQLNFYDEKYIVEIKEEKQELVDYKKGMVNVRKYKRAAILLNDRCRYTTEQICEAVQVSPSVKRQFVEESSGSFELVQ